jgi:hypothetical protein
MRTEGEMRQATQVIEAIGHINSTALSPSSKKLVEQIPGRE